MPTVFTHALLAAAAAAGCAPERTPVPRARLVVAAAVVSVLPDLDVAGLALGVRYGDALGHRGLSHSLPFALLLGVVAVELGFRAVPRGSRLWWGLALGLGAIAATHGLLDCLTDGGLGVALLAPFDNARWFAPWRPIPVSPIGLGAFLSGRGLRVLAFEVLWLWLPCLVLAGALRAARSRRAV